MIRIRQLLRAARPVRQTRRAWAALLGRPQSVGVVRSILAMTPKKPNSWKRRVLVVELGSGRSIRVVLPWEARALAGVPEIAQWGRVLVARWGRVTLPAVQWSYVRGSRTVPGLYVAHWRSRKGGKRHTKFYSTGSLPVL